MLRGNEAAVYLVSNAALAAGFNNDPVGTHGSRTIMLAELRQLLHACPNAGAIDDYRRAIVDDNALGKQTVTTRKESLRRLRELYALSPSIILFRALHDLWNIDVEAQPMLALLCAAARDSILRATADAILAVEPGASVTPQQIADATANAFPDRYGPTMLANIGRHAASSWQQSGHLTSGKPKQRIQAHSSPTATTYALLLAYLCGDRGDGLFTSFWARLLDAPVYRLRDQAAAAARLGYLDYRSGGGVTEIDFGYLLRNMADHP